jgi:hypothetical protein
MRDLETIARTNDEECRKHLTEQLRKRLCKAGIQMDRKTQQKIEKLVRTLKYREEFL